MDQSRLEKTIVNDEGFSQTIYQCSAGKWTIGIGRNVQDKGITYAEAMHLLKNDILECTQDLQRVFGDQFERLPDHTQEALINMRFQLGPGSFRTFRKFIAAIKAWDFAEAERQGLDSKWAKNDTPGRAKRVLKVLRHGY
jgi:lysozyme